MSCLMQITQRTCLMQISPPFPPVAKSVKMEIKWIVYPSLSSLPQISTPALPCTSSHWKKSQKRPLKMDSVFSLENKMTPFG